MLQEIAIHEGTNWSSDNKFQLNPVKCKKLSINFTKQPDAEKKISLDSQPFERVPQAKILGVTITKDLRWNVHIENIVQKASKRIYLLRQPKKADVEPGSLVRFYTTCIRSVVEYSCQVFHTSLLHYLSYEVELFSEGSAEDNFSRPQLQRSSCWSKTWNSVWKKRNSVSNVI